MLWGVPPRFVYSHYPWDSVVLPFQLLHELFQEVCSLSISTRTFLSCSCRFLLSFFNPSQSSLKCRRWRSNPTSSGAIEECSCWSWRSLIWAYNASIVSCLILICSRRASSVFLLSDISTSSSFRCDWLALLLILVACTCHWSYQSIRRLSFGRFGSYKSWGVFYSSERYVSVARSLFNSRTHGRPASLTLWFMWSLLSRFTLCMPSTSIRVCGYCGIIHKSDVHRTFLS